MVGFNISLRVDSKSLQGIIPGFQNGIPCSNLKINSVHAVRESLLIIRTCNLFLEVFAAKLTRVVITSLKSPGKKTKRMSTITSLILAYNVGPVFCGGLLWA